MPDDRGAAERIRVGPAGWSYQDWAGQVYPKPRPRGFDAVASVAQFFDTVEINSTFYRIPGPATTRNWAAHVAGNPHCMCTAKLWQGFTHVQTATARDYLAFRQAMAPLHEAGRLGAALRTGLCRRCLWTTAQACWGGEAVPVLALAVADEARRPPLLRRLPEFDDRLTCDNGDLPLAPSYLDSRGLFPCGRGDLVREGETSRHIRASEPAAARDDPLPELRIVERTLTHDPRLPLARGHTLVMTADGVSDACTSPDPRDLLGQVNGLLARHDLDLILTDHGDTGILPQLGRLARHLQVPLRLARGPLPMRRRLTTEGRACVTYGTMSDQAPDSLCYGRWHIDRAHAVLFQETGFSGIVELARLAKLPGQRVARASIGTMRPSMQLARAGSQRLRLPWRKGEPERWKTAALRLMGDQGGRVFQPPVGGFEHVAALDCSAMYPSIMVRDHMAAEPLCCRGCDNQAVPEAGYTSCARREGLVPAVLRPLLACRTCYQSRLQDSRLDPALAAHKAERVRAFPGVSPEDGFEVAPYQALLREAALELLGPFG